MLAAAMILQTAQASAQQAHPREVSGGYLYLRDPRTDLSFTRGWTIAGAQRLGPVWGVVRFDRSATAIPLVVGDARLTERALLAGARASLRVGPFRESVELLVGAVGVRGILFGVESGASRVAFQPGLSLDYLATDTLGIRVAFSDRIVRSRQPATHQMRAATELVYSFR